MGPRLHPWEGIMEHPRWIRSIIAMGCSCDWWTDLQCSVRAHNFHCPVHHHPDVPPGQMAIYHDNPLGAA